MIVSHAPIRLLKIQFKRLEVVLRQEFKEADEELKREQTELNESQNINDILRRHESKFHSSNFFQTCESYLKDLRIFTKELVEKKCDDRASIQEVCDGLQNYWTNLVKKIENVRTKLTILPETKENFELHVGQLNSWLNEFDVNATNLFSNNLPSTNDYKRVLDKSRVRILSV